MTPVDQAPLHNARKDILFRFAECEPILFAFPYMMVSKETHPELDTAGVGYTEALFNDEFFNARPPSKQRGLVLHEAFHALMGHIGDPWVDRSVPYHVFKRWQNIAQDMYIELTVDALGKSIQKWDDVSHKKDPAKYEATRWLLPNHPRKVLDANAKYIGWDSKSIYEDLKANAKPGGGGKSGTGGDGAGSEGGEGNTVDDHSKHDAAQPGKEGEGSHAAREQFNATMERVREATEATKAAMKAAGTQAGTGHIKITPDEPKVPWQSLLRDLLTNTTVNEGICWSRVQRRPFMMRGEYLPSRSSTRRALDHVRLFVDTSGSMHGTLDQVAGDIMGLIGSLDVRRLSIHYYDVGLQETVDLDEYEIPGYQITSMPGGGGTQVYPAMKEVADDATYDDVPTVVLTDGYDDYTGLGGLPYKNIIFLTYEQVGKSDIGHWVQVG